VGSAAGPVDGKGVGAFVGAFDGCGVGVCVGNGVGSFVGNCVGVFVGYCEGTVLEQGICCCGVETCIAGPSAPSIKLRERISF
jgi:hypothetical protein